MLFGLTEIATIKAGTRSGTTAPYSVSYASNETSAQVKISPLKTKEFLTNLGAIPAQERFTIFVHKAHTVAPGFQVVKGDVTYEIETVEEYEFHYRCIARRLQSE